MFVRIAGRTNPLCLAQKAGKIGCFIVKFTDNRDLAEVCASSYYEFFQTIPCSPTQAMLSFVDFVYSSNRW
jgi:hypothetical protein